ncbi:MAG: hypothetical protein IKV94_01350 [Clostridia bacterium]|nr:hypothetical protein [Clostridia bacterium]
MVKVKYYRFTGQSPKRRKIKSIVRQSNKDEVLRVKREMKKKVHRAKSK